MKRKNNLRNSVIIPIFDRKTIKKEALPQPPHPHQILLLENFINSLNIPRAIYEYTDKQLAKLFHLKIVYEDPKDFPTKAAAILEPTEDNLYNAVIRTSKRNAVIRNSIIKEIATYLLHMKSNGRINETFTRYKDEKITEETLLRDTLVAIMLIPLKDVLHLIDNAPTEKSQKAQYIRDYARTSNVPVPAIACRIRGVQRATNDTNLSEIREIARRTNFLPTTPQMMHTLSDVKTIL